MGTGGWQSVMGAPPPPRQRYRRMRRTLIKFRSLVHIYVNRRRYLKVRWGLAYPGGGPRHPLPPCCTLSGGFGEGTAAPPDPEPHPHHLLPAPWSMGSASLG